MASNALCKDEVQNLLLKAIQNNRWEEVRNILKCSFDINTLIDFENEKISPLGLACKEGCIPDLTKFLIQKGADISLPGSDGKTAMHYVCEGNDDAVSSIDRVDSQARCEVLEELINSGANINRRDNMGRTPLFIACDVGDVSLVRLLVRHKCDVNLNTVDGDSPVMVACRNAKFCTGRRGGRENAIDPSNIPPICITKILMEANADVSNATLLPTLVQYGNEDLMVEFLNLGMDINMLDDIQLTPLGNSCFSVNVPAKIVKLLLERGADVDKGGGWKKQKPLIFAYVHNSVDKIRLLLSYGAKLTPEEMTELVSLSFTKSILENPEVISPESPELLSWQLLLAAGFQPMSQGCQLTYKMQQLSICSSYDKISPWIQSMFHPLYSLKELCRINIRNNMRLSVDQNIRQLELPERIEDFLMFEEFTETETGK